MLIRDLRYLASRYIWGKINYQEFRAEFVPVFLVPRHDAILEHLIHSIESECADFCEVHSDENLLRSKLSDLVIPQQASVSIEVHSLQNGSLKPIIASRLMVIGSVGSGAVPQFASNPELNDAEFSLA